MASNPFDQFDAPQATAGGNPFDQFDAAQSVAAAPAAPSASDPFAGDALLSNEALARVEQGGRLEQTPQPFPLRGVARYFSGLSEAAGQVNRAPDTAGLGTLEALGALATGGIAAPILGTIESAALGTQPEDSFARYTYQPRTESGKAQLGLLGAVASPITDSGADVALGPLFAAESRAVRVPRNAPSPTSRRGVLPGASDPVVEAGAPTQAVSRAAAAERPAGLASVSKDAPSIEQLKTDAKAAYKRAEDAGIQVSEFSFKKLKGRILKDLGERVDPTLHPDTTAALKRIVDTKGAVSLEKLDSLRQIANDAKGSVKPADQTLAARVVDSIDDYVDGLSAKDVTRGDAKGAAALKEARDLYTRQKKGEQIQRLFERAEIKAGANYTQSGLENALRGEFKALALDAKKMKRFTAAERAAIIKVAKGGKMENAMRYLGKFAPTGVVSGVLSGGLGAMIGGPAGAGIPLAGLAGRAVATRMTMRNANKASEIVRRGRNALAEEAPKEMRRNALLEY